MKRRVTAIAVVLAAVALVATNWRSLWQVVKYERTLHASESTVTVWYKARWGSPAHTLRWDLLKDYGTIQCTEQRGEEWTDEIETTWNNEGQVIRQIRGVSYASGGPFRNSPPWWPHPPLIDLKEFEE